MESLDSEFLKPDIELDIANIQKVLNLKQPQECGTECDETLFPNFHQHSAESVYLQFGRCLHESENDASGYVCSDDQIDIVKREDITNICDKFTIYNNPDNDDAYCAHSWTLNKAHTCINTDHELSVKQESFPQDCFTESCQYKFQNKYDETSLENKVEITQKSPECIVSDKYVKDMDHGDARMDDLHKNKCSSDINYARELHGVPGTQTPIYAALPHMSPTNKLEDSVYSNFRYDLTDHSTMKDSNNYHIVNEKSPSRYLEVSGETATIPVTHTHNMNSTGFNKMNFLAQPRLGYPIEKRSGEKPLASAECKKVFIGQHGLKKHEKCDVSGSRCHLTTHKRVHTVERPYICDKCGKGFTFNSNLYRHKRKYCKGKIIVEESMTHV